MITVILATLIAGATALAQQGVPPPPQPLNDAPANAEVMKLLRSGVSERVILHVISATPGKFDTSADALTALKQAGADDAELSAILAQGAAPTIPPAANAPGTAGPTLEVTMKFIQDKLSEVGTVNFAGYVHDSAYNQDAVQKFSSTTSNIVANPGACSLTYHRLVFNDGRKEHNENILINLRDVKSIAVMPDEQDWQMYLVRIGETTKTVKDVPDVYVLNIKLPRGVDYSIRIYEQEMADRIAKAMVHAVELCGGGGSSNQQEPF
jgi:hypothetical protein